MLPNVTLVGERLQAMPVLGEVLVVRVTVPVNPWTLLTITVEVPTVPAFIVTLAGVSATVKS